MLDLHSSMVSFHKCNSCLILHVTKPKCPWKYEEVRSAHISGIFAGLVDSRVHRITKSLSFCALRCAITFE